ncbi:MAG: hypothetical protein AAFR33_13325, partial [Pseudomonadota bacterium]
MSLPLRAFSTAARQSASLAASNVSESEADWRAAVEKALRGKDIGTLEKHGVGGLLVRPLYRETDVASAKDPFGHPGSAPFIRGPETQRDRYLPW